MIIIFSILAFFTLYAAASTLYLFFFAATGRLRKSKIQPTLTAPTQQVAVLIPAYREDAVIVETAKLALQQSYPSNLYRVVVIADSLQPHTLQQLRQLPVQLIEVQQEVSTKANALNEALRQLPDVDVAVVLDADNVMATDFLTKITAMVNQGFLAVQGHRTAKNLNRSVAVLDAVSEEINNHIFRKGHRAAGLSAALIGSAMAFDYAYFKAKMAQIHAVSGFDKELEMRILLDGNRIAYAEDAIVYDEKVQRPDVFRQQRTRWIAAQLTYLRRYFFTGWRELLTKGNVDLFDKVLQMALPPRVLLVGLLTLLIPVSWLPQEWNLLAINCTTFALLITTLLISAPRYLLSRLSLREMGQLPVLLLNFLLALLHIRRAKRKFIHTPHGEKQ